MYKLFGVAHLNQYFSNDNTQISLINDRFSTSYRNIWMVVAYRSGIEASFQPAHNSHNKIIMLCELELHEYDAPSDLQFPILVYITLGLTGKLKIHPQNIGSIPLESMRCCLKH